MPALLHAAHAPMFSRGQRKTQTEKKDDNNNRATYLCCLLLVPAPAFLPHVIPVMCVYIRARRPLRGSGFSRCPSHPLRVVEGRVPAGSRACIGNSSPHLIGVCGRPSSTPGSRSGARFPYRRSSCTPPVPIRVRGRRRDWLPVEVTAVVVAIKS